MVKSCTKAVAFLYLAPRNVEQSRSVGNKFNWNHGQHQLPVMPWSCALFCGLGIQNAFISFFTCCNILLVLCAGISRAQPLGRVLNLMNRDNLFCLTGPVGSRDVSSFPNRFCEPINSSLPGASQTTGPVPARWK